MNSITDNPLINTPSAATERSTTLPCWLRMNFWTAPSGSLIEAMTWVALMCVSNLSLMKLTVRLTYFSELPEQVGDLLADERADGDEEHENPTNTPIRIRAVAVPRRHPRDASRLTPGSMASDRNNDTNSSRTSAERLDHTDRVTIDDDVSRARRWQRPSTPTGASARAATTAGVLTSTPSVVTDCLAKGGGQIATAPTSTLSRPNQCAMACSSGARSSANGAGRHTRLGERAVHQQRAGLPIGLHVESPYDAVAPGSAARSSRRSASAEVCR